MPIPNCTLVFTKSVESVAAATVVGKDQQQFETCMGWPDHRLSQLAINKVGFTSVVNRPMLGCQQLTAVIKFEAVSSKKLVVLLAPQRLAPVSCKLSCKFEAPIVLHTGKKACSVLQCNQQLEPRQVATRNRSRFWGVAWGTVME